MASNNMYRVGDYVYFESSATAPFQIRRIDELNKTPTGAVEAKVACYFRRRDVSSALINQAEKYYVSDIPSDEENNSGSEHSGGNKSTASTPLSNGTTGGKLRGNSAGSSNNNATCTEAQRHRIKHRELFLSRQIECLPATHIRGKCSVTLYNDAEPLTNYLAREDAFYYKLIYDPSLKTLQEDRGAMRIGSDHQSDVDTTLKDKSSDPRLSEVHENLVWQPSSLLSDREVDLFCLLAKAVGTLGRAYDTASVTRQPLLLSAAAAAGRDITRQYAHDLLHRAGYDLNKAIELLLPGGQPTVCRDQLEEWSASEAQLFEDALEKYSKNFVDIQSEYLPWKTHKSLVELYYFWKTTDRYVRQRRTKLAAQEYKLKQVYIPNYSKPNPAVLYSGNDKANRGCEGCSATSSSQWYTWGPQNMLYCLCAACWSYWKRYGGLKNVGQRDRGRSPLGGSTSDADSRLGDAGSGEAGELSRGTSAVAPSVHTNKLTTGAPYSHLMTTAAVSRAGADLAAFNAVANPVSSSVSGGSTGPILPSAWFGGGPRGTQCFRTPSFVRMARVLCPTIVWPRRMARRPGKPSALPAVQASALAGDSSALGIVDSNGCVSLSALKVIAQPVINRLPDPTALLSRSRKVPPVDTVLKRIAKRQNIDLESIDFSLVLGSAAPRHTTNGPVEPSRAADSPAVALKRPCPSNHHADNDNGTSDVDEGAHPTGTHSRPISPSDNTPPCKKQAFEFPDKSMLGGVTPDSNGIADDQPEPVTPATEAEDVTCA